MTTRTTRESRMRALRSNASSTRCKLLGCPLDLLRPEEVLWRIRQAIRTGNSLRIEGLNVAKIIRARADLSLMRALEEAEVVHLDGVGVAFGGRILGYKLPPKRTGCDLMLDLLELAAREGYRVYFLGGPREVVSEMVGKLRNRFSDLIVVGARDGFFRPDEEIIVVDEIRSKRVDILFVGISSPKKELFVKRWWKSVDVKVSIGVGGSFDVLSGRMRRAPLYMQHMGMEWLFRLLQEPNRLAYRYLSTNTIFAALLIRELLGFGANRLTSEKHSRP